MKKITVFNLFASLIFLALFIYCAVYLFHVSQKADHIYRPAQLFNPHHIESPDLSKCDFPDTMSHDLNKFCYIFCQQQLIWMHKGEYSYIFSTKDDRHVVKFLPLQKLSRRFTQTLLSAQLSFDELRDETGLEYLHLNRTTRTARGMSLVDFYGQQHRICGDHTRFIVQKKASLLFPTLTQLIEEGKLVEAKKRIDQVLDLTLSMAKKKISDGEDEGFLHDAVGFTEDRAIYLDVWQFSKVPFLDVAARMRFEFRIRLEPLRKWLSIMCPDLAVYYRERRRQIENSLRDVQIDPNQS